MYSSTVTKELSISLFMILKSLTLDKSKDYFVEIKTSNICYFANENVIDIVA